MDHDDPIGWVPLRLSGRRMVEPTDDRRGPCLVTARDVRLDGRLDSLTQHLVRRRQKPEASNGAHNHARSETCLNGSHRQIGVTSHFGGPQHEGQLGCVPLRVARFGDEPINIFSIVTLDPHLHCPTGQPPAPATRIDRRQLECVGDLIGCHLEVTSEQA